IVDDSKRNRNVAHSDLRLRRGRGRSQEPATGRRLHARHDEDGKSRRREPNKERSAFANHQRLLLNSVGEAIRKVCLKNPNSALSENEEPPNTNSNRKIGL